MLEIRAFDAVGERGPISTSSYLLDTRLPNAPRFTDPMPPAVGNDAEVSWSWADEGNLVECRHLRNGGQLTPFAECTSPDVLTIGRQGEATYGIEARAVDAANNVSPITAGSYRYDVTAPAETAFITRPPLRGTASSVGWSYAVPTDTSAFCVVTRNGTVTSEGACTNAFALDLRGQQPATWTLSVHLVDAAGNAGPSTVGSYTLTTATAGRVDGPGGGGAGNVNNGPDAGPGTGGGGSAPVGPGSGPVPAGVTPAGAGTPAAGAAVDHPRAGAVVRIPSILKKAARRITDGAVGILPETNVPAAIKNVLNQTITKPQLPLALLVIVLLFLLVQNRIDRRDPKLAAAPVSADPELTFGPILRPGGATA